MDRNLVRAYAEEYTEAQIRTWRREAMAAHAAELPRVELTGTDFEGGSTQGEFVRGAPEKIIKMMTAVLDYKVAEAAGGKLPNPAMSHADFSQRKVGW